MSIASLPAIEILRFIVNDFESAWEALADKPGLPGRGNFMFALQAMILLELACRVCAKDATRTKLSVLSDAMVSIEPRYFTRMPGPCGAAKEFDLPGPNADSHLLAMLFDVVRNGKAHQYQSAIVRLADGDVDVDITGATASHGLARAGGRRARNHLRYKISDSGDLALYVRTDQLFLDLKKAIEDSGVIEPGIVIQDVTRPKPKPPKSTKTPSFYSFTLADLKASLRAGGHEIGHW